MSPFVVRSSTPSPRLAGLPPEVPHLGGPAPGRLTLAAQAGLLAGPFLSMVDSNIVNVAIPDIARELQSPLATAQWVVSGYLLALAAALASSAYLAKRFGTRRVYLASLLGFTVASGLCALAPNIQLLIALRVLQGALGAPLVPLAMTMLLGGGDRASACLPPPASCCSWHLLSGRP